MNVSRETSLSVLLEFISDSIGIGDSLIDYNFHFTGMTRPALSLVLFSLHKNLNKSLLLLFNDNTSAENIYLDCLNLSPESVAYFPESNWNEADIDGFNLENERYRSETVNTIRSEFSRLLFSSIEAAEELVIDDDSKLEKGFALTVGSKLGRQELINTLSRWGYENSDHTETPKTYSTRGGILDIFLPYSANPTRIEFFGDEIESIRIFNPRSQRTINNIKSIEILPPPSINLEIDNKISLLKLYGDTPISVKEKNGLFSITAGMGQNKIDLDCKSINLDQDSIVGNGIAIKDAKTKASKNVYLFSDSKKISKIIEKYELEKFVTINCDINSCFYSPYLNILTLSQNELNKQKPVHQARWSVDTISEIPQRDFTSLDDIDWGDYLVHQDFGIGLYRGLEKIKTREDYDQECIKIEYADNANVYVPVEKFNHVHKMIVTGNNEPTLSTLNSPKWSRQKQIAKNSAHEVVQDLINLFTARNRKRGFNYDENNSYMQELRSTFPYDETPGQIEAINSITADMEKDYPVDRLVCGDVGFGKTEVALRAALKSIISGKKVLFLTPTTILADQHYISTKARFEPLGVKIELLSRFKTKKEQTEILEKMLIGSADMVIGTHRLLSQDVNFPDLGLLIIDEEHRFGVKHKEKLRQLRETVDVLTLTATPIPRTLQQSLLGVRDISRISTPPKTRRPIKTFVQYMDWNKVKKVIDIELSRGGQTYFLHNDIASMPFMFRKLVELFPNSMVGVAHGQMSSKDLEKTVLSFFDGEIDLLLCTTIIESGLDVSNANTIVINNAQNFGLSQLYQIRGRVGRSYRQAYCYLLLPKGKAIGENARKRLKAIEQYTSLGSGYDISLKDLEIRGAGNLFGYKQSGHIATVGFEMYCKILQEAVDETVGNVEKKQMSKISIPIDALLDDEYIQLVQDRLYFYQQLSDATSLQTVNEVKEELKDRFGKLPQSAINLLDVTKLRIKFTGTSVFSVTVIGSGLKIGLSDFEPFKSVEDLINNISEKMELNNLEFKFAPAKSGFTVTVSTKTIHHAIKTIDSFVELFSN